MASSAASGSYTASSSSLTHRARVEGLARHKKVSAPQAAAEHVDCTPFPVPCLLLELGVAAGTAAAAAGAPETRTSNRSSHSSSPSSNKNLLRRAHSDVCCSCQSWWCLLMCLGGRADKKGHGPRGFLFFFLGLLAAFGRRTMRVMTRDGEASGHTSWTPKMLEAGAVAVDVVVDCCCCCCCC